MLFSILDNREEEVSRWVQIWESGSCKLAHTNPTPPDSLYIWTSFSLFTLEYGGQVAYMAYILRPIYLHFAIYNFLTFS